MPRSRAPDPQPPATLDSFFRDQARVLASLHRDNASPPRPQDFHHAPDGVAYITKKIGLLEKDCSDLARRCEHFREQGSNALSVAEELRLMLVHRDASLAALKAEAEDQAAVIQRLRAENGRLIHLQDNSSQDAAQAAGRLAALQNAMDELRQAGEAALRSNLELRRENDSLALKNCELAAAAEAGSAEPWQLQCTQLKSDKSLLSSRLQAAEAAASDAAAELKHAREAAEAASEEIHMLKAEVQELRHQVSQQQHFASEKERALQAAASARAQAQQYAQDAAAARDSAAAAKQQLALLMQAHGPADDIDRDELQKLQQEVASKQLELSLVAAERDDLASSLRRAHARAKETDALLLDKESACTAAAAEAADAELRVGLRRRRKAAAAAAAQMKVLLDKFKVWAQGGGGVGVEEVLKQQVEAAVEGYKHQLQALHDDVRSSQEQTLQQQAEIADLKNGRIIQQLEQELFVSRARCDELQRELYAQRAVLHSSSTLARKYEALQDAHEVLKLEAARDKAALAGQRLAAAPPSKDSRLEEREIALLEATIEQLKGQLSEALQRHTTLAAEVSACRSREAAAERNAQTCESSLKRCNSELADCMERLSAERKKVAALQNQLVSTAPDSRSSSSSSAAVIGSPFAVPTLGGGGSLLRRSLDSGLKTKTTLRLEEEGELKGGIMQRVTSIDEHTHALSEANKRMRKLEQELESREDVIRSKEDSSAKQEQLLRLLKIEVGKKEKEIRKLKEAQAPS